MKKASLGRVVQQGFCEVVSEVEEKPAMESSEGREYSWCKGWGLTWEKLGV